MSVVPAATTAPDAINLFAISADICDISSEPLNIIFKSEIIGIKKAYDIISVKVLTDYDTFPYPRYWRGISESYNPIVSEREAGWRPRMDSCYKIKPFIEEVSPPNICFQSSCSTIYPCSTEFSKMHLEKNTAINNCSIQYR